MVSRDWCKYCDEMPLCGGINGCPGMGNAVVLRLGLVAINGKGGLIIPL